MSVSGRPRALTLFELVMALSILAVLIAILAPLIDHAREASRTARCLSHLRDQGALIEIYTSENDEHLPPADRTAPRLGLRTRRLYDQVLEETVMSIQPRDYEKTSWLASDAGGPVGVFTCPSVRSTVGHRALLYAPLSRESGEESDRVDWGPITTTGYPHYEVNDYLLAAHVYGAQGELEHVFRPDPAHPNRAHTNLRWGDLVRPSDRMVAKDVKVWRSGARLEVASFVSRFKYHSMHNEHVAGGPDSPAHPARPVEVHRSGINLLFADGHAGTELADRNYWKHPDQDVDRTRYGYVVLGFQGSSNETSSLDE